MEPLIAINTNIELGIIVIAFIVAVLQWVFMLFHKEYPNLKDSIIHYNEAQPNEIKPRWLHKFFYIDRSDFAPLEKLNIQEENSVSFYEDKFFMAWNLLPIALCSIQFYIIYNWSYFIEEINLLFTGFSDNCQSYFSGGILYVIILFSFIASLFSLKAQTKKQANIIKATSSETDEFKDIYWWDIRISPQLYTIRYWWVLFNMFIFLTINLTAILTLAVILISINESINDGSLTFYFFHPDENGGFVALEKILLALSMIFIFTITNTAMASIDHSKQGLLHKLSNLTFLIAILIVMGSVFYMPGKMIYNHLHEKHSSELVLLKEKLELNKSIGLGQIDEGGIDKNLKELNDNKDIYAEIFKVKKFHLFGDKLFLLLFSFLIPFFSFILPKIRKSFERRKLIKLPV